MINDLRSLLVVASLLMLAGCAGVTARSPASSAMPPEAGAEIVESEPRPVMSHNRAVIALLDRARLDTEAGQREAAGASLERALRIEPRNGWLWHELAQLRIAQGKYVQAVMLAQKSMSFARSEPRLQTLNWRLIGNARVAQGDSPGAEQAFGRAAELERAAEQPGAVEGF